MIKFLGFLIGSATSIAIILLVTGLPEFHLKDPQIDQQRFDAAVEKLMARKLDAEQAAQEVTGNVAQVAESIQEDLLSSDSEVMSSPIEAAEAPSQEEAIEEAAPRGTELTFVPPDEAPALTEMQWYSFWNPFRSEIAANGFVSQLEKVTGLDYRVVRIKTGIYEVAFAYNDDDERRKKLSQISAATGLELPDS
jgi:hypothetical protein